jgi:hypothetical protein
MTAQTYAEKLKIGVKMETPNISLKFEWENLKIAIRGIQEEANIIVSQAHNAIYLKKSPIPKKDERMLDDWEVENLEIFSKEELIELIQAQTELISGIEGNFVELVNDSIEEHTAPLTDWLLEIETRIAAPIEDFKRFIL